MRVVLIFLLFLIPLTSAAIEIGGTNQVDSSVDLDVVDIITPTVFINDNSTFNQTLSDLLYIRQDGGSPATTGDILFGEDINMTTNKRISWSGNNYITHDGNSLVFNADSANFTYFDLSNGAQLIIEQTTSSGNRDGVVLRPENPSAEHLVVDGSHILPFADGGTSIGSDTFSMQDGYFGNPTALIGGTVKVRRGTITGGDVYLVGDSSKLWLGAGETSDYDIYFDGSSGHFGQTNDIESIFGGEVTTQKGLDLQQPFDANLMYLTIANQPDVGIRASGSDEISLITNNVERVTVLNTGTTITNKLLANEVPTGTDHLTSTVVINPATAAATTYPLWLGVGNTKKLSVDQAGNVIIAGGLDALNAQVCDTNGCIGDGVNASWNQTLADTLYYSINNPNGYFTTDQNNQLNTTSVGGPIFEQLTINKTLNSVDTHFIVNQSFLAGGPAVRRWRTDIYQQKVGDTLQPGFRIQTNQGDTSASVVISNKLSEVAPTAYVTSIQRNSTQAYLEICNGEAIDAGGNGCFFFGQYTWGEKNLLGSGSNRYFNNSSPAQIWAFQKNVVDVNSTIDLYTDTFIGYLGDGDTGNRLIYDTRIGGQDSSGNELPADLIVNGNFTGNQFYAEGYGVDIGEVAMASSGVYYNITNFTQGAVNGATFNADGGVIAVAGLYKVDGSYSFSGTASNEYHLRVAKNDVGEPQCHAERVIGTGGDVGNAGMTCFVRVDGTDHLNAQIENIDSAGNPDIHNINFNMVRIGD